MPRSAQAQPLVESEPLIAADLPNGQEDVSSTTADALVEHEKVTSRKPKAERAILHHTATALGESAAISSSAGSVAGLMANSQPEALLTDAFANGADADDIGNGDIESVGGPSNVEDGSEVDAGDPDLGILRLYPQAEVDPDLGILRLKPAEEEQPRRPSVYFTVRSSAILSDNAFSSADPVEDGLLQAGIGLRAVPALGSRTFAVLTVDGNVVRYFDEEDFDYDELELGASLFRRITRRAYIDIGWRNEQLFRESGDRLISNHQLRARIGRRDLIGPVQLDTAYQLRRSFADPDSRSRWLNRLSLSASYPIQADVDLGISYQLSLTDFIDSDRDDYYQQILGQLSYRPSSATRISLFGGGRFGNSDRDTIDFDSALFGVSISVNLPLF